MFKRQFIKVGREALCFPLTSIPFLTEWVGLFFKAVSYFICLSVLLACVCMCIMYVSHVCTGIIRGQKRALDLLKLGL